MVFTTTAVATMATKAILPSIVEGLFGVYRDSKERVYKFQALALDKEKHQLEFLKFQESQKEREEKQQRYYKVQEESFMKDTYFLENAWPLNQLTCRKIVNWCNKKSSTDVIY